VRCNQLIDYYGYGTDINLTGGMKIFMLFEFVPNGSLEEALKPNSKLSDQLSLRRRFHLAYDIIAGIRRFHSKQLIHKDIKPDNILITGGVRAKIGDLGVSKLMNSPNEFISDQIAPVNYRAPDEVITFAFDIYSFGLVLNHLFTGEKHESTFGIHKIRKFSEYFGDLIKGCLKGDYRERPNAKNIEIYFEKFDKFFWEKIESKIVYMKMSKEEKDKKFREIVKEFEKNNKFKI